MTQIETDQAPILSCTLYNHETEIRRRISVDLSAQAECTVVLNLQSQHTLSRGRSVEQLSDNATFIEVSEHTRVAGEQSVIEADSTARELYDSIIAKLHERKAVESQGESKEKEAALAKVKSEISGLDRAIATRCGVYCSTDVANVEDALRSVQEYMTKKRPVHQQHMEIKLNVKKPGKVSFVLCYRVCQAGWLPTYTLHTTTANPASIKLSYYALIEQETTEDWKDVNLAFATGSAPDNCQEEKKGEKIWFIPSAEPPAPKRPQPDRARPLIGGSIHALPPHFRPVFFGIHHGTDGGRAFYSVEGGHSIPAKAGQHKVKIGEIALSGKPRVCCVHSVGGESQSFFAAKLTNESPYLLLPTEAVTLFRDDKQVGEAQMPLVAPGAKFDLTLGPAENVNLTMDKAQLEEAGAIVKEPFVIGGNISNSSEAPVTAMVALDFPHVSAKLEADAESTLVNCASNLDAFNLDAVAKMDPHESGVTLINKSTNKALHFVTVPSKEKKRFEMSFSRVRSEESPVSSTN